MTSETELWKKILTDIELEVSRANYLTLFRNTVLLAYKNGEMTIGAPSPMIIDLLQKRFLPLLKETIEKHTKEPVTLHFSTKVLKDEPVDEKAGPLFVKEEPKKFIGHLPRVRPDYTFDTIAVSSSNQLAYVSAQTVAKNIGHSYNPLFLYGPVGVGKTHLMQAIANEIYNQDPTRKIIYITSEEFTNEVVEAIRGNDTAKMKKRFRSAHLLIIDDVQFIAGKDRVQEELFHTFNILIDNHAQIVLSSDRPPQEIKKLEKRLSSRFAGGLTVDIEPPDFELRTAILLIKARKYNIDLPIEAAKVIADREQDARSLEGALLRVVTRAQAMSIPITEELALKTLGASMPQEKGSRLHPDDIIQEVCTFYNVKPTQLKGPKRDASLVRARQVAMYLLKKDLDLSLVEIGNLLGGRDHTTVMHGVEKIESLLSTNQQLATDVLGIRSGLQQ